MNAEIPSAPSPTPRRPWLLPAAFGVGAGLIVGALVGVFLLAGGGARGGSADADAEVACGYVAGVSDEVDASALDLEDPVVWRLQAIGPLASAAAKADPRYEEFGEQGMDLYSAVSRLDPELLESSLAAMVESCESF